MKLINLITLTPLFTKILLSISLISFIISHSTWSSSFINNFPNYFIAFPWQLVSHAFDKSSIFLLCNGLLVFIAKTSTLFDPSSSSGDNYIGVLDKNDDQILEMEFIVEISERQEDVYDIEGYQNEDKRDEKGREVYQYFKGEKIENGSPIVEDKFIRQEKENEETKEVEENDYDEDQKRSVNGLLGDIIEIEENEEEVVEENNAFAVYEEKVEDLNTEELNKKFDDFIRKMKEELRVEAQQQLVLVK